MTQSVAELHATYPYDRGEHWWPYPQTFDTCVEMASGLHQQEEPFAYLENLKDTDPDRATAVHHSLLYLPPDVVIDEYGADVAAWTVANTSLQGEDDHFKQAMRDKAGYDITDFDIAQNWNWQHGTSSYERSATDILAQYSLMQGLKQNYLDDVDLPGILRSSAHEGIDMTTQRLGRYALIPLETDDYNTYYSGGSVKDWSGEVTADTAFNMWLDTPTGFALTYKDVPNAMAGVAMNGADELMMYQLQGVQGKRIDHTKYRFEEGRHYGSIGSRGLAPLDWKKALVTVTEEIARNNGIDSTAIQAAKNNVWTKKRMPRDKDPHLPIEVAERIYDAAALRLGYEQSEADRQGDWHKNVI